MSHRTRLESSAGKGEIGIVRPAVKISLAIAIIAGILLVLACFLSHDPVTALSFRFLGDRKPISCDKQISRGSPQRMTVFVYAFEYWADLTSHHESPRVAVGRIVAPRYTLYAGAPLGTARAGGSCCPGPAPLAKLWPSLAALRERRLSSVRYSAAVPI